MQRRLALELCRGSSRRCVAAVAAVAPRRGFALSETGDNAGAVSGHRRFVREKVRIFQPARNPMQQGGSLQRQWKVEFLPHSTRWSNPLMGWTSSEDTVTQLRLMFDSKDEAVAFAEEQGYQYELEEPRVAKTKVKSYGDNFESRKYGFKKIKK